MPEDHGSATKEAIGHRLRAALAHRGWSVSELVRRLEEADASIKGSTATFDYLNGNKMPPVDFLVDVAELMEIRKEWLVFQSGSMDQSTAATERLASGGQPALIDHLATGPGAAWLNSEVAKSIFVRILNKLLEIERTARWHDGERVVADKEIVDWGERIKTAISEPLGLDAPKYLELVDLDNYAVAGLHFLEMALSKNYRNARVAGKSLGLDRKEAG